MKRKSKNKKRNYGVKSIDILSYLEDYCNPERNEKLSAFYDHYFSGLSHEEFRFHLEYLRRLQKEGSAFSTRNLDFLEIAKSLFTCYPNEMAYFLRSAYPVDQNFVTAETILTGDTVLVRDSEDHKSYYHGSNLELDNDKYESLYDKEHHILKKKFK